MAQEMSWMSLAGSVFSTACTVYFWFVRARRERPKLTAHLLEHEFFLGQGRAETRTIGVKLAVVLANGSILPNAVIGARMWLKTADGAWESVDGLTSDAQTPLPLNLPPQQTGILRLTGRITFATSAELEAQRNSVGAYVGHYLRRPVEIEFEILGLNSHVASHILGCDPDEAAAASFRVRAAA
jgi:hypothetical protein